MQQENLERHNNHNHRRLWKRHRLTAGQWLADKLAESAGSWAFIVGFMVFLVIWMWVNLYIEMAHGYESTFDPFPFILLNLILSCLAAIQAPVILMSQNRAAERDRRQVRKDYYINRKAEKEIKLVQKQLLELRQLLGKQSLEKETKKIEEEIRHIQKELEDVGKSL